MPQQASSVADAPRGPLAALPGFVRESYAPGLHVAFAGAWFLALDGAFSLVSRGGWIPAPYLLSGVLQFFLVLFYLRAVDEWKDLDYDRIFNPDRPLVRGSVRLVDLWWYLGGAALLVVALHFATPGLTGGSLVPLAILVLDMAYGLALAGAERRSPTLRENMLLNLAATYPVNVALSVYAYSAWLARTGRPPSEEGVWVVVAFALAFLHYEFARKTAHPARAKPGKRLYSAALGVGPAAALTAAFATAAVVIVSALLAPRTAWGLLPLLAVIPALWGLARFIRQGRSGSAAGPSAPMTPLAMAFLTLFYVSVLAAALLPRL